MEIVYAGSLESISRPSSTASEKGRKSQLKKLHNSSSLEVLPPEDASCIPHELFSAIENDVDIEDFEDEVDSGSDIDELSFEMEENNSNPDTEGHRSRLSNATGSTDDIPALQDSDVDPQIREGMEKIKKLDRILADKLKKEKEIKNQRTLLEKMWKEQLQQMVKVHEDDGTNSNKNLLGAALLALELGNEEVLGSSRDDPSTPIFATQPLGTEDSHPIYQASSTSGRTSRGSTCSSNNEKKSKKNKKKKQESRRRSSQSEGNVNTNKKSNKSKETGHDFIERNKKLAADAANVIPMTEEEKQRLEKLLSIDVNEMMDNPFQDDGSLRLTQGVGFTPDEESARALADIDRKLESLVPPREIEMLSSRSFTDTPLSDISKTTSQISSKHTQESLDDVDIGERVLREEKDARTTHQRIMDIEKQLENLRKLSEDDTVDTISQSLLSKLINEDSRTTSSSSTIAETVVSSLTTPDYLALEASDSTTPTTHRTLSEASYRTLSAFSDVTLTSDVTDVTLSNDGTLTSEVTPTCDLAVLDVETPRTLTDSLNT